MRKSPPLSWLQYHHNNSNRYLKCYERSERGEVDKKGPALAWVRPMGCPWRYLGIDSGISFISQSGHCVRSPSETALPPPSPCVQPFVLSVLAGPVLLGLQVVLGITRARLLMIKMTGRQVSLLVSFAPSLTPSLQ